MRLQCTHRNFEGTADKVEAWYGTKYSEAEIPEEKVKLWANPAETDVALHLPRPNELIASIFLYAAKQVKLLPALQALSQVASPTL